MTLDREPKLTLLSVELTRSGPEAREFAFLVYADDDLVAVLTPQSRATTKSSRSWILEAGFGPCRGPGPTVWHDLAEFHQWVLERCRAAETGSEPHLRRWSAGRLRNRTRPVRQSRQGRAGPVNHSGL